VRQPKTEESAEIALHVVIARIVHLIARAFLQDEHGDGREDHFVDRIFAGGPGVIDFAKTLVQIREEVADGPGKELGEKSRLVLI